VPAVKSSLDLVAVLGGEAVDVQRIADALRPGGVVYWEVDRRRSPRLTPRRAGEMLRRAGLEPLGAYAVRPRLDAAELYLPLHEPGAARWFVRSVYIPARPAQRMLEAWSRALVRWPAAFAAALPLHVAVAQKPPRRGTTMAEEIAAKAGRSPCHQPALLNHSGARVVFAYCDAAARPNMVAKLPKVRALVERTQREHDTLRGVHESVAADIVTGIPRPLGAGLVNGMYAAWETGQPGASMARRNGAWGTTMRRRLDDLDAAAQWITRLHREHRFADRVWDGRTVDEVLCDPIEAYTRQFGVTDAERFLFRRVTARAVEFRGSLPMVWEHGDYTVWNLFRRGESSNPADDVVVLDWEGAAPGLPYVDLFRFAVHWTELASRRARRVGRRALLGRTLFGDATRAGSAARSTLDRYLDAVGVDRSIEPVLITRLYVELSIRRHQIAVEANLPPDHPRASNPAIDMVGHLASFADRW
jgi:aminoglycoside phosphotransferase (APT) family kinase protein